MCGIFGFSEINDNTRCLAPLLAYEMENRGDDSWGMTNGIDDYRFVDPITKNFHIPDSFEKGPAIFHTRAASVGLVTEGNAHPFRFTKPNGEWIVGIHNGHINNHTELGKKYDRKFDVDSMHIFQHILDDLDTKEISGWGACAWFKSDSGARVINLARFNHDALHVVRLTTGELVFCSTLKPLIKGASVLGLEVKHELKQEENRHYRIVVPSVEEIDTAYPTFKEVGPLVFGFRYTQTATQGYQGWTSQHGSRSSSVIHLSETSPRTGENVQTFSERLEKDNKCRVCKAVIIDRSKKVVCQQCEVDAYDTYLWTPSMWWYMLGPAGSYLQMDWDQEKAGVV